MSFVNKLVVMTSDAAKAHRRTHRRTDRVGRVKSEIHAYVREYDYDENHNVRRVRTSKEKQLTGYVVNFNNKVDRDVTMILDVYDVEPA